VAKKIPVGRSVSSVGKRPPTIFLMRRGFPALRPISVDSGRKEIARERGFFGDLLAPLPAGGRLRPGPAACLIVEVVLTGVVLFVIHGATDRHKAAAIARSPSGLFYRKVAENAD